MWALNWTLGIYWWIVHGPCPQPRMNEIENRANRHFVRGGQSKERTFWNPSLIGRGKYCGLLQGHTHVSLCTYTSRTGETLSARGERQSHFQENGESKGVSLASCDFHPFFYPLLLLTLLLNKIDTCLPPSRSAAHSSWPPNHSADIAHNSVTASLPGRQIPWKKLSLYLTNCNLTWISMFQSLKSVL